MLKTQHPVDYLKEEFKSQAKVENQGIQQGNGTPEEPSKSHHIQSKNEKASKGLKRAIEDVLPDKELQGDKHKRFKRSGHGQIFLPKLELDTTNNVWQVSVPRNSNCLFTSVILAYLIPVKDDGAEFKDRFEKLFPYDDPSSADRIEESLRNYNNKLEHIKKLIKDYSNFLSTQDIYSDPQWHELIQGFRNRVEVSDPNVWGTDAQISKISEVLKCKFRIFSDTGQYDIFPNSYKRDLQIPELKLFHDVARAGGSRDGSYYKLGLERNIGNRLFSKVILREFVEYFVEEFEIKLNAYHMVLEGKASKAGKISDTFAESLGRVAGGALGGTIGFFLGSPGGGASSGASVGGKLASLLGREIGKKHHKERVVKLLDLVYYSKENKAELRKVLVEAGFDIFQSFEMQFMGVTVESKNRREALRKLAEDATNRVINYYKKEKNEGLITEAIMLGESKIGSFLGMPIPIRSQGVKIKYKDQSFEQEWIIASLYEKVGLVREQETPVEYYKGKESRTEKYGYRRLFVSEDWNEIKGSWVDDNTAVDIGLKSYHYTLSQRELESASNDILEKIKNNDGSLGEERIKKILSEVKGDILAELNVLKENQELSREGRDVDTLNGLRSEVSRLNINEYLEEFKQYLEQHFEKAKQERQQILEAVERKGEENREGHEETHKRLDRIEERLANKEQGPIWFDIRESITSFTGRQKELSQIASGIEKGIVVISGLGGIGKSELTRRYIQEHSQDYDGNVIWINAENYETLVQSFTRLAKDKLNIVMEDSNGKPKEIKSIVEDVYRFFLKRKSLFIFDNAEKYRTTGEERGIDDFLPHLPDDANKPYIVITSRNQGWGNIKVIPLGIFSEPEAIEFIKKALKIENDAQDQDIAKLAETLQRFPLALQQAVVYIKERDMALKNTGSKFDINDYLKRYKEETKNLLNFEFPKDSSDLYTKTTFAIWKITTDKIKENKEHGTQASEILEIIAYFAPNSIPAEIFLKLINDDGEKLGDAIQLLKQYSMINEGKEQNLVDIHRLVQKVTRIKLKEQNKEEEIIGKAFVLLKESFPYDSDRMEDYPRKQQLLPHFEAFLSNIDDWIKKDPAKKQTIEETYIEDLLTRMGDGYGDLGDPKRKKELLERALAIKEKHYGRGHFEVAKLLTNLGNAYGALGDPRRKKELLERALAIEEKHYGRDHFEVAITLNNLGNAYGDLGDPHKAKELFERALAIQEKHYGRDHFQVAITLNNLGNAYGDLGDPHKAKELFERALEIEEKHYGRNHFQVAKLLTNLGNAYGALGDHNKKKELLERALAIEEKHYGRDHFQVAITLNNLGNAYGDLGDHSKQKELLERALAIKEKHYGRDHFQVAMTLNNLGIAYGALGDHQKKKELLERALAIDEKHYGSDNFQVAITLTNLGIAYGALGNPNKQKELLERALAIEEKHYGSDHFEVAITLDNLGNAYGALGNSNKQKELLERALPIMERHYGRDHFQVAKLLTNLGNAYGALGDPHKAKELLERALAIKEKHYGRDNFEVAITLHNLGVTYGNLGDLHKAKELLERALEIEEKHYGRDHFQVAKLLTNLGNAYGALGYHNKKKELLERALPIMERHYGSNHKYTLIVRRNIERAQSNLQQIQSNEKQQKAFLTLSKFVSHHLPHIAIESVRQGLYLPAFEARNLKINGKCVAITRTFSQALFSQDESHQSFLSNLQTSAELYERLAQGKQLSQREGRETFALSGVLDNFEQELDSPTSSLPSTFSHIKSYKTLDDLSTYVTGLSGDFALHLVTSNHVVAIYRVGDNYAYFDTNVAFVSGITSVQQLMRVLEKAVEFSGYEVEQEGFLVEYFDVGKANQLLSAQQKETLTKPIQTERHLLSLQDQELGPININGKQVFRVTLYDIGSKLHLEGSAPILINADMNLRDENFIAYLNAGKISVTAREYLDKLRNGGEQIGQEGVKIMPFSGSSREIKDAEQARELILSDDGSKLKSYELSKLLKSPVEQSMKALPYYLEVANSKHWPNRLTNAAGRVSLFHGGFGTVQSLRYGDDLGFALGAGEMSFSVLSQLIEDGVVKVTPQIIKQMKHGLLLSRGFGGMISNPFDMYDLIDSLIDLSHATKGSKEWRDGIAGSVFAGGSVLSSIGFTAINKPGAGTLIGLGIIMGQSIYSGASMVEEYKKYDLTFDEKFRLFWHTFAMQLPPEDVQYIEARKNIINEIARNVWESLEKSGAKAYATGLGEITFKDPVRDELPSNHPIRPYGQEMNAFPIPVGGDLSEIRIKPRTPVLSPSNAEVLMGLSSIKGNNYRDFLSRILPDSPSPHAKVFCLPASSGEAYERDHTFSNPHSVYRSSNDVTSYCENAIAVENKQSSQEKMIHDLNLVKEGIVVGSNEYENQFIISENFDFSSKTSKPFLSRAEILGGENTKNVFSVTNRMFKGKIIGGKNSSNVVDISNIRNGYLVDVNGSQIDRREYVKNHYMFGSVNEQRDNLHVSGVDNFVLSANVTIKGGGGNYTFYIKPNVGHSRINVLAEKGYLVFPETNVLSNCNFTYNLEHNTLSLQMPRGFRLDAENYLIKQEGGNYVYRFELADKGGAFEPLINLNVNTNNPVNTDNSKSNTINSFYLRTKTNLFYNLVPEWYRNMTQGREVYGVVDLLNYPITGKQPQMIFGTSKSDIIPLDKAFYAEGGNGSDAYSITADKSAFTTEINNYAGDKVNDVIYIPTAEKVNVEKIRDNLYIYTATYGMEVKNYFRGEEYKHLTIVDKNKNVFIPLESQSGIKLVPFYHARDEQSIFSLERTNGEIVVDAKLDKVRIYRDNSDLLLVDDKPLIIKLEKFYDKHWNNLTLYFQDKERLNYQQLEQLSKLAINYRDEVKNVYYGNVREYPSSSSPTILHNDTERIGIIVFEDPSNIKVSTVNDTDVVFSDGNNTVSVKNWNDTDHRISVLRFNLEEKTVEVTGLEKFDLSQSAEIQSLINKATLQNIANQQLENLDTDVVNGMKYLLSVRGIENGIDTYRVLGFDSVRDQEQFMLAYYSQYNEESLIQHNQVVEALVWMVAKGYSNEDKLILNEVFSVITSKRAIHRIVEKLEVVETIVPKVESFIRHHKEALSGRIASSLGNSTTIDIEENYQRKRRAINEVPIANSGSRPTSWIASVAQWVKGFIGQPTAVRNEVFYAQNNANPGTPGTEDSANGLEINSAVVHNTLLLGDVAARLITGNKYKQPKHDSLLSPKELIERRMDNTVINAINNFEKICDDKYGNDFQNATNNDEPMTCLSNLSLEKPAINMGTKKGIL